MARVALVTGGMGGLGEAICIKLSELGYKVVTTYSPSNTKADEWVRTMNNNGYGFKAYSFLRFQAEKNLKFDLLITVDNGIVAHKEFNKLLKY